MHLLVKCKHALHFVHCTWYMISRLRASILIGFFVSSQLSCSHRSTQPLDETSCSSVMRFNLKHFHSLHSIFCSVHFFHMLILNARENGMQQTHTYTSIRTEKKNGNLHQIFAANKRWKLFSSWRSTFSHLSIRKILSLLKRFACIPSRFSFPFGKVFNSICTFGLELQILHRMSISIWKKRRKCTIQWQSSESRLLYGISHTM